MIEKFKKMDNSKKIPIVITIAVVLIVIIILLSFLKKDEVSYKIVKEDDTKDLVYTVDSKRKGKFFINVPYINIDDSSIKSINEDIDTYTEEFLYKNMIRSDYEYEVNGKVLSLVIKTVDYDDDTPIVYFKTYNVNLETNKLVSDSELLNSYDFTYDDVSKSIEKKFIYFYKDLLKEEYFDEEECDYDCFLENRDVENYTDDIYFYINKGNLVVYKPFEVYSIIGEEKYFSENDYKFIINK